MGSQEHLPASVFAPSPPLTTSPGASDCDVEGSKAPRRGRQPQAPERDLSPSSSSFTPDVDRALEIIKSAWQGNLTDSSCPEWCTLIVSPSQFLDLRARLEEEKLLEYFEDLRYDYNPDRSELVLRLMASPLHECLKELICDAIKSQLRELSPQFNNPPSDSDSDEARSEHGSDNDSDAVLSRLASKITSCGHMKIGLESEKGQGLARKSPDGQLCYDDEPPPQFVVEVGYSQTTQSLQQLAKDYYERSNGEIKTVLTIDIRYRNRYPDTRTGTLAPGTSAPVDRSACFCLYRGPKRIHYNQAFRDVQGKPMADSTGDLHLFLSDLVPDATLKRLRAQHRTQVHQYPITISARQLSNFLRKAERLQEKVDAKEESGQQSKPGRPAKRKTVQWNLDVDSCEDGDTQTDDEINGQRHKRSKTKMSESDKLYQGARQAAGDKLPERKRTRSGSRDSRLASQNSRPRTRSQSRSSAQRAQTSNV